MKRIKKYFCNTKISYKKLILLSIVIGVLVGIINRIPFLYNTSFQDIAIVFDMWIIFAIFIIINCKNSKEAIIKCFLFFLISQPLIYFTEILIEVLFNNGSFKDLFILYFKNYYIGSGWFYWTLLTIPGSFIAYQVKKDNLLSALILSVATIYLSIKGTFDLINCLMYTFPYHILNSILCLIFSYLLVYLILKNKKNILIVNIINTFGVIIAILVFIYKYNIPIYANEELDINDNIIISSVKVENEQIAEYSFDKESNTINVYSSSNIGNTTLIVTDIEGKEYYYYIESTSRKFIIKEK